ncbi:Ubiquitin-conjugating enzyme E2 6 [Tritrichomonas foetus]|uniref:Ubiquitin-conjugating enzyme E2 6 n=1 Tax=Tritrichomonas foetus TaxID=1144522 RepID=A0A1J4KEP6_9EUKA|nr:Ubiquitin-conjugating enzyme E2 6 [Tritrichomonas foetus]|eukprot:OHT08070.1 Ubiquitin-conjugating enzyme E2 6 [Tritrichomonas foetus]
MHNTNSQSVRRLMSELRSIQFHPDKNYTARPVSEDDFFVWHFIIRGPPDTPFENGIYHGRIVFPSEYPLEPPDIYFLTPNGRFETNKRICLSITSYHPESWKPSWDVCHLLVALIAFLPTEDKGIGYIKASDEERRLLAEKSREWHCNQCLLHLDGEEPQKVSSPENENHSHNLDKLETQPENNKDNIETQNNNTETKENNDQSESLKEKLQKLTKFDENETAEEKIEVESEKEEKKIEKNSSLFHPFLDIPLALLIIFLFAFLTRVAFSS